MKIFITGGAGFIGSHVAEHYIEHGHEVTLYDDFSTGKLENIVGVRDQITLVRGDVRDVDTLSQAMIGADIVIHLAAIVSVQRSIENPIETHDITSGGTLMVLEVARRHGIQKVLLASSAAVYGDQEILPIPESAEKYPLSPYAIAKLNSEQYGEYYAARYDMSVVAMRFFNVYGPRQDPKSNYAGVISKFIEAFAHDQAITVYGDGEQTRDFIYVKDLARAIYELGIGIERGYIAINIGNGIETSLNTIIHTLESITGKKLPVNYTEPKSGDIIHSYADISLLRDTIAVSEPYSLYDGLSTTLNNLIDINIIGK